MLPRAALGEVQPSNLRVSDPITQAGRPAAWGLVAKAVWCNEASPFTASPATDTGTSASTSPPVSFTLFI